MFGDRVTHEPSRSDCGNLTVLLFLLRLLQDVMRNPFGVFDNVMSGMRSRMEEVHRNFVSLLRSLPSWPLRYPKGSCPTAVCFCAFQENVSADSNAHSFSSSSVMTYSKVGNEPPKVYQATSSTRCAPGGVSNPVDVLLHYISKSISRLLLRAPKTVQYEQVSLE